MFNVPAGKHEHRRVAFKSPSELFRSLYSQIDAIPLDGGDCGLGYAGSCSQIVLTHVLKLSDDSHRLADRYIYLSFGSSIFAHVISCGSREL